MSSDIPKRKQSLYMPESMLNEIVAEAQRQDRSLSWIVQQTWRLAKTTIEAMEAPPAPSTAHDDKPGPESA